MDFVRKYLPALLFVLAALVSCRGNIDPEDGGNGNVDTEEALVISADRETFAANAKDIVYFTVMYGTEDVSKSKSMNVRYRFNDGDVVTISAGSPLFATDEAGTYVFHAIYTLEDGTVVESSNSVTVTATLSSVEAQRYGRKVLGMQFTSAYCHNCPIMSTYMKDVLRRYGDEATVVSFHADYAGKQDPMTIAATGNLMQKLGFNALPYFVLDMNPDMKCLSYLEQINGFIDERLAVPAECGVAISTEYDSAENMLIARTHIKSSVENTYKYIVFLVEDNIRYEQWGVEDADEAENYAHNNVVRAIMTLDYTGDKVNSGRPLAPGEEVVMTRGVKIRPDWNMDNMRVVSAALTAEGESMTCANVNECKVGESVDYIIK